MERPAGQMGLMDRLEAVYSRCQERHLYRRLEESATTMEETLLQIEIAQILFDESIELNDEVRERVAEVRNVVDDTDGLDDKASDTSLDESLLDELEQVVSKEAERIENRIHGLRVHQGSTVRAMQELSAEVGVADSERLAALADLLEDWQWKVHIENKESFEARREEARQFAHDMRSALEASQDAIGAGIKDESVENLVETLLNGSQLTLSQLDEEERESLINSPLAEHLLISLG